MTVRFFAIGVMAVSVAACTTAPYANVATTYSKTIELLEASGKEPLGRLRGRVRAAYVEAYHWDVEHGATTPRPKFSTLLCQPQRPYARAVANLGLQARAASGLVAIAQPTPKELAPAIGTLGANYSHKLPPIPNSSEQGPEKEVFDVCLADSETLNPAGEFVDDQRINELVGGMATGLTEVISLLTPSIVSFIGFYDQRRRAEAIRVYFAPCPTDSQKGECGNAKKLKEALAKYGETLSVLNRYERRRAAVAAKKKLTEYFSLVDAKPGLKAKPGEVEEAKAKTFKEFLDGAALYDTSLDSNILANSKKVEDSLDRLEAIASGTPKEEDLPAVIESFVVATQAFLAAAVAQEKLADDAETRKKLSEALDKFLGREKRPDEKK